MKELYLKKKYILGYLLQISGIVLFVCYGINLQNRAVLTFRENIYGAISFRRTPDYSRIYRAIAVNCIMLLVSAAIYIYGVVFVKKHRCNSVKNSCKLKIFMKAITLAVTAGLILIVFIIDFLIVDILLTDNLPPQKLTAAMASAKITAASNDGEVFMVDAVTMYKESGFVEGHDRIRLNFSYKDNSYDVIYFNNNDFIPDKEGDGCSYDSSGRLTVHKKGNYEYRFLVVCNWLINNKLPFMQVYDKIEYDFVWKTDSISYSFSLLPEYFIYAKEYGSYTHTERYTDFDYETDFNPQKVPAGAQRKTVSGSHVYIKEGAADYSGNKMYDYVYDTEYTVYAIDGDRAVVGLNDEIIAAVNTADLYFADEI